MKPKRSNGERSMEPIAAKHLARLAELAIQDRLDFFARYPQWGELYSNRVLCVALCQGAAQHYLDGTTGVKDFDVWTFYQQHPACSFPARRIGHADFGRSPFGRHPAETTLTGRKVDMIGRSIPSTHGADIAQTLREYLATGKTDSARLLAHKAVVLIDPPKLRGRVVWPPPGDPQRSLAGC
jgi:hypothetical protein